MVQVPKVNPKSALSHLGLIVDQPDSVLLQTQLFHHTIIGGKAPPEITVRLHHHQGTRFRVFRANNI